MSSDFARPDTPERWIRPRRFKVEHVELDVRIDLDAAKVSGRVQHRLAFFPHARRDSIDLDQQDLAVSAVTVDGASTTFSLSDGRLSIALPAGAGERPLIAIDFACERPRKGLYFVAADPARGEVAMAWTQGAMEDHHHWFPCFDDPNNLATYRIAITRRDGLAALANGDLVEDRVVEPGWRRSVHDQTRPHVLYLVNVVVGDLVAVEGEAADVDGCRIPVRHWLPRGREAEAGVFRATRFAIEWLSRTTGVPYAWTRYGHVVVHRFLWGGMENTTLTTITDRALCPADVAEREDVDADDLVIHELVHQWYGDLLTMKAWSDIWLNESFATWLEARGSAAWRAARGEGSEAEVLDRLLWANREAYLEQESSRYRRALVTRRYDDAYELFDRVAYEKGSLVLHHLEGLLGAERMAEALRLYTTRHSGDLVESADLRQAIEDATGDPLDWFFAQWLERSGHPTLVVRSSHDAGRGQLIVEVEQKIDAKDEPWRLPTTLAWSVDGRDERRPLDLRKRQETLIFPCASAPDWVCVDSEGRLPVEWEESLDEASLLARLAAGGISATARARAAIVAAKRSPTSRLVGGLANLAGDAGAPELVRDQAIAALGGIGGEEALAALRTLFPGLRPRLRRSVAAALGRFRTHHGVTMVADLAAALVDLAARETSLLTAGELLAARGALEHPGATPALRPALTKPSWNDRLAIAALRGLAASGEAAAIDDIVPLVGDRQRKDPLRGAACAAAAKLGALHLPARPRIRRALEICLEDPSMAVRAAAAKALGNLGDPAARGALAAVGEREPYGNVSRVIREAATLLGKAAAATEAQAALTKRVDDLASENADLKRRLEALEKKLG